VIHVNEASLLQGIREHPDDNTLRLVYADWLEERAAPGDLARAEFIRVQIALETKKTHTGRQVDEKLHRSLMARGDQLLKEHKKEWVRPLIEAGAERVGFQGGLACDVDISADNFLRNAEQLFALAPVQSMHIIGRPSPKQIRKLAASPHLAHLTSLGLADTAIGDDGAQALAGSPHLAGLKSLYLGHCGIDADGVRALAASPHLAGLERLYLGGNEIGDAGAALVADSSSLKHLTELDVGANAISDAGAAALAASSRLAGLKKLYLWSNDIGDAGAAALARSPHLAHLTLLGLADTAIGDDGAQALAASPHLAGLTDLDLKDNHITDVGVQALAASPHLAGLKSLYLEGNDIGAAGAAALVADSSRLEGLIELDLTRDPGISAQERGAIRDKLDSRRQGTGEGRSGGPRR
jgi:uncharacterized protein (TIGR02996 family)